MILNDHRIIHKDSIYAIYAYIGMVSGANVGKYASPMECLGSTVEIRCLTHQTVAEPGQNIAHGHSSRP